MNRFYTILLLAAVTALIFITAYDDQEAIGSEELQYDADHAVLVFSKTSGWRHDSIEPGIEAIHTLGEENGFSVTATEDASMFTKDRLAGFDAVIFLNTTETVFDDNQRESFQEYIRDGGGFVGIHSATDTEYDWPWYGDLVGAYFDNHPNNPNVREAVVLRQSEDHPSTKMLPQSGPVKMNGTISDTLIPM
jgi:type 1 glutamine amidotransferase